MQKIASFEMMMDDLRLGKANAKRSPKLLRAGAFMDEEKTPPARTDFWSHRTPFAVRSFGNRKYGDCTRASQANAAQRAERIETRQTPLITDEEVIRVYKEMTARLYGADWVNDPYGADTGAFETDALNEWRNPATTFRDTKGRPLTIDAYTAINFISINAVKNALALAGIHGIKVCFLLPLAFRDNLFTWDIPEGQQPIDNFYPGSWGGHSLFAHDYDENFLYLTHSWGIPAGKISWRAFAIYCDEAYLVIDSVNAWKKKKGLDFDLAGLTRAVNQISPIQITA